ATIRQRPRSLPAKRGSCSSVVHATKTYIDVHRSIASLERADQSHRHPPTGGNRNSALRRIPVCCPPSLPCEGGVGAGAKTRAERSRSGCAKRGGLDFYSTDRCRLWGRLPRYSHKDMGATHRPHPD